MQVALTLYMEKWLHLQEYSRILQPVHVYYLAYRMSWMELCGVLLIALC